GQAAALDAGFVIAADALHAAVERLLRRVHDLHGIAEIGKTHRDAAAHRAGTDHRRGVGRPQRRVARDVGELRGLALGEEGVAQGARLGRIDLLFEQFALQRATLVERQITRRLDRLDAGVGGALVAGAAGDRFAERVEHARVGFRHGELVVAVADARQRSLVGDAAGEGDRGILQIALGDDFVDYS